MLYKTHLVFGILVALFIMPFVRTGNKYIFLILVIIGALLPDVDTPHSKLGSKLGPLSQFFEFMAGHRGLFHSIFFAILIPWLVYHFISKPYGVALFVGYLSHLFIDGWTKDGINYLHPLAQLRTAGFIKTGSTLELVVFFILIALILIKLI